MATIENQPVKSKKELLNERISGKYPDKDFSDEEVLYGQISDDYDDYDNRIKGYQEREKALTDMFDADERSAAFLMAWKNGQHPMTAFIRRFGKDGLEELVNNEEKQAEFEEAEAEYLKNLAESKKQEEERTKNIDETNALIDQYQAENGLTEDAVNAILDLASQIADDLYMGIIKKETLDLLAKANNYDQAVLDAENEGEVRGKNAKIDERLRKRSASDGTVALGGAGGAMAQSSRRPELGALDRLGGEGNKTIWERGNEKRTRYNS